MSSENETIFNCIPCNYKTTKKHIYENHFKRETHLKRMNVIENTETKATMVKSNAKTKEKEKEKQLCVCGNYYKSILTHQNSCSTFKKEKDKNKDKETAVTIEPINKALYEKASADFYKYMCNEHDNNNNNNYSDMINNIKDNDSTTTTTIVDDAGNTIVEKTTYSTTNSSTDYDVHIDSGDFIKMMNTSLSTLKETGDRKSFVTNFFQYMFKHVTDIRHTSD